MELLHPPPPPHPETKMQHGVLPVDTLPGLDHLRKEGFDYVQVSWFEDVVLRPGAEHLQGPSQPAAHLLFAEELDFGTEAPLGPGRHAVVDGVGGALLQTVHRDGFSCGKTHSNGSLPSPVPVILSVLWQSCPMIEVAYLIDLGFILGRHFSPVCKEMRSVK